MGDMSQHRMPLLSVHESDEPHTRVHRHWQNTSYQATRALPFPHLLPSWGVDVIHGCRRCLRVQAPHRVRCLPWLALASAAAALEIRRRDAWRGSARIPAPSRRRMFTEPSCWQTRMSYCTLHSTCLDRSFVYPASTQITASFVFFPIAHFGSDVTFTAQVRCLNCYSSPVYIPRQLHGRHCRHA